MTSLDTAPGQAPWPIVVYFHHVGRKLAHFTSMSVEQFTYALDLLQEHCEVLPATALADEPPGPADRPPVVISFDDGYAETLDTVQALLSERGLSAAFFVVTSEVGEELDHTTLDVSLRRASWTELRAASAAGHVIASHGHRHEPMWELTSSVRAELRHSRELLSAQLERTYDLFAFPYGVMPTSLAQLEFARAFSTKRAPPAHWDCAPRAIRRVSLEKDDERDWPGEIRSWVSRWPRSSCAVCDADVRPG